MSARIFGLRFSIFYAFLTIGLGMQLPFLPLWLHAKGLTVAEIGLVIAGMTASRFVAIPVAAYFADRYRNRRGLIILFSLASAFGYLLLGLSSWIFANTGQRNSRLYLHCADFYPGRELQR